MNQLNGMDANTSRCVADHLAILADQIGEVLAELEGDSRGPRDHLMEAFVTLWKLRWELGVMGGQVVSDLEDQNSEAAQ